MRPAQRRERPEKSGETRGTILKYLPYAIAGGVIVLLIGINAWIAQAYGTHILPGIRVGRVAVGGLTQDAAVGKLQPVMDTVASSGIVLQYGDKQVPMDYSITDTSGVGLTTDILDYDADASVQRALQYGAGWSPSAVWHRFRGLFRTQLHPMFETTIADLEQAARAVLQQYETPALEPGFSITSDGTVQTTKPRSGQVFDLPGIAQRIRGQLDLIMTETLTVQLVTDDPLTTVEDATKLLPEVQRLADQGALQLRAGTTTLSVKPKQYLGWFVPTPGKHPIELDVRGDLVNDYLKSIAPTVNVPAKEARFLIGADGKITAQQSSSIGTELDYAASADAITSTLLGGQLQATLVMKTTDPMASSATISDLGVVELVAEATTDFTGSPVNRRHNIQVGADLLNGLLIKPGAEFSVIKAIGPVETATGYLPELVIKGNRTIPEVGGGLCQIGTTMFRVVMNAGLPILERKNHSYRVHYYEPPVGMDATVYDPKPDFRFRNDYSGYLLLQTRVDGNKLTFQLWGKKDGRIVVQSKPRTFNLVQPPQQQTIETTDIAPGVTKCTEKAHPGSDAEFTYSVTYADGKKVDTVYRSHYIPWRAVCLVGVKTLKPSGSDTNSNTNTNSTANANTNTSKNANTNAVKNTNASAPVNSNTNTAQNLNTNAASS